MRDALRDIVTDGRDRVCSENDRPEVGVCEGAPARGNSLTLCGAVGEYLSRI